jgi:Pyridoxamine 5'-phosphate oxidase
LVRLDKVRELGARESGLAVAVTLRSTGRPRASVVNAGVVDHPMTGEAMVGFVSRGAARKLEDLRHRPDITLVFRSGREWVAAEGAAELAGPNDELTGLASEDLPRVLRTVYAAVVGGTAGDWTSLDETMAAERQTAVLVRVFRLYPEGDVE